jgi:hypothetical protein
MHNSVDCAATKLATIEELVTRTPRAVAFVANRHNIVGIVRTSATY